MKLRITLALAMLAVILAGCSEKAGVPETETTGSIQAESQTSGSASATTTGETGGGSSDMTPDDKEFVTKAGMAGLAEVKFANLALQQGANADVKAFAQRMLTDHSKTNNELAQFATTKGLALAAELEGDHEKALEHLRGLSGAEFDKAYMDHMVADHEKTVADFEKASTSATDTDLKAWAGRSLPTLREHLQLARDVTRRSR